MIKSLICLATGHSVNRNRVWHDGQSFRTKCEQCKTPMIRDRTGWRRFDAETDGSENRQAHPNKGKAA